MASRATYTAEEASDLLFSSVLDSEDESEIEDDPEFPFPSLTSDDEALLSDAPIADDQSPSTPERPSSPSRFNTASNATIHKLKFQNYFAVRFFSIRHTQ